MIIPYDVDVPFARYPVANWLLTASILLVFGLQVAWIINENPADLESIGPFDPYVLDGFTLRGLFGHMWIHGGIMHIVGNAIFLWVFGNAVCQKIGNFIYFPVYLALGLLAAFAHMIFSGEPAIGASGAINGVVGMYLILYPTNNISCAYWWGIWARGTFEVSGFWMILFWLAFDIFGAIMGFGGVAYYAHLGGFAAGIGIASALLLTKVIVMDRDEESLLQVFARWRSGEPSSPAGRGKYTDAEVRAMLDQGTLPIPVEGGGTRPVAGPAAGVSSSAAPLVVREISLAPEASVPIRDNYVRYNCSCGQRIKTHVKYAGQRGKCPGCGKRIYVPEPE